MATIILQVAGAALGGLVGGPVGAMVGRALGGLAGAAIDGALLSRTGGGTRRVVEGPRLQDVDGITSTEGAPIPRVYGRARVGGQLIWATRLKEEAVTTVTRTPSSGGKGSPPKTTTIETTYSYYANIAIGLCEGPVAYIRRAWADGKEIDLTRVNMRVHRGSESQTPDPLIIAKEGAANAPAYRGLAYVVFDHLSLAAYGNRIPQFSFEVVRPVEGLGSAIRAVNLIPGASEFGYMPGHVTQVLGFGASRSENRHQLMNSVDVVASLDMLTALCPNLERVALVVSWFGDDLRVGSCTIAPRVETAAKATEDGRGQLPWRVSSLTREAARLVSHVNGRPAYGGTPSDDSVIALIRHLQARGLEVVLYPFIMMDVPAGNGLPDPWTGAAGQPAYPWRGRLTCHPAPGRPGSPDGGPAVAAQVQAFFGHAQPQHFTRSGDVISYQGPPQWSLRRQILHYAHLAVAAGGVHGFVIGSELVSLTRLSAASGHYPATSALIALAEAVRAVVGPGTAITYAADWTEYGAHVRDDGREVRFPLDPLWASPAIDAVGIDFYPPLSDWRDGTDHADAGEARAIYDRDYLRGRLTAGEAYDWYYASEADRISQRRSPITDGAYGKPWLFRQKDLAGWWANEHVERVNGVETGRTAWQPGAKPVWLTELGVPAVDKGTNAPNVFPDPKSIDGGRPPFSSGGRDDLIQVRGVEAMLAVYGAPGEANPLSPVYGGTMVAPGHAFVWAWDARPFPAFPELTGVWSDGHNWQTGHWLTGRLESVPLDRLVAAVLRDFSVDLPQRLDIDGMVDGYVVDRTMAARQVLEPLAQAFGFDALASGGVLRFAMHARRVAATLGEDDLVPDENGALIVLHRQQETELPREVRIGYSDSERDFRRAAARSRRLAGESEREASADLALVTRASEAARLAEVWLQDLWVGRESAEFSLSPRLAGLEVGDIVALPTAPAPRTYQITRLTDGTARRAAARRLEPSVFSLPAVFQPLPGKPPPVLPGRPHVVVLDLPAAMQDPPVLQYLAAVADPWPGQVAVWRSSDGASFAPHLAADLPAVIGETIDPLPAGPVWRWDRQNRLTMRLGGGVLTSVGEGAALSGANLMAVRGPDGAWEIIAAADVELIDADVYRVGRLLRGLAGSDLLAARTVPAGATVVLLDRALVPLTSRLDDIGRFAYYRAGPATLDHGDPAYAAFGAGATDLALRPLAPVHLKARRMAEGIVISFIRRTRSNGDGWELVEVPLGEDVEAYEIDLFRDGELVRRLRTAEQRVFYAAEQELADFGGPQHRLDIAVAQLSAVVGRGFARRGEIDVR
ncbi:hypothetical protein BOQ54_06615 [Chelatococcus daeguensis]|uniref:Phage tail protein n=1 Tax=Chelatococcus daeguensis TaxID=444444 RepID=A0AAC9NY50_9HYPH|nr:glycoside hydrolase/phage tail family protein [Chelatococcus daeguensis]APF37042.1 hypothetical protein BOQ54_06615 [Chelatococcus daeguensis]